MSHSAEEEKQFAICCTKTFWTKNSNKKYLNFYIFVINKIELPLLSDLNWDKKNSD